MTPRRRRESFWKSREWTFSDGGEPELLTLTEFRRVLGDYWGIPVSRDELVALASLGAFTPQYLVLADRVAESDRRVVDLMLPVYRADAVVPFIGLWHTKFALHVPVATTTVDQLREDWGPRLRQAREALGLKRGAQPDRTRAVITYRLATDKTWKETGRALHPTAPPEAEQLRSQASRHQAKERKRVHRMHILGPLPEELQPTLQLGLKRLSERIAAETGRVQGILCKGGHPSVEDEDLLANITHH